MHVENIVVGKPIIEPKNMFAFDDNDWNNFEKEKTIFTEERFLPRILVDIGFAPSVSEIRRNRKDLVVTLDKIDFLAIKWGKKKCWILVGE